MAASPRLDSLVPPDLFAVSVTGNAAYLEVTGLVDMEDPGVTSLRGVLPYALTVEDDEGNVSEEQQACCTTTYTVLYVHYL